MHKHGVWKLHRHRVHILFWSDVCNIAVWTVLYPGFRNVRRELCDVHRLSHSIAVPDEYLLAAISRIRDSLLQWDLFCVYDNTMPISGKCCH